MSHRQSTATAVWIACYTHLVDELMRVDLEPEGGVEDPQPAEDPEEVVVAPEEHVQTHFDVVAVFVYPAPHLYCCTHKTHNKGSLGIAARLPCALPQARCSLIDQLRRFLRPSSPRHRRHLRTKFLLVSEQSSRFRTVFSRFGTALSTIHHDIHIFLPRCFHVRSFAKQRKTLQ